MKTTLFLALALLLAAPVEAKHLKHHHTAPVNETTLAHGTHKHHKKHKKHRRHGKKHHNKHQNSLDELVETESTASMGAMLEQQAEAELASLAGPAHISEESMLTSLESTLKSAMQSEAKGTEEGLSAARAKTHAIKNIESALTAKILQRLE